MGYAVKHARIKPKYSPQPNAAEARHERRMREHPCIGCGRFGVELHHTQLEFPEKRWRRDHRFQLPVCAEGHRGSEGIHGLGSEEAWLARHGITREQAIAMLIQWWGESVLIEQYEGRP